MMAERVVGAFMQCAGPMLGKLKLTVSLSVSEIISWQQHCACYGDGSEH